MKIITISNLYPRPDQPIRGMFNFQFFSEIEELTRAHESKDSGAGSFFNICLVPEWRVWRWSAIRKWKEPSQLSSESPSGQPSTTQQLINPTTSPLSTVYLPVFYLPFLGRSINWWFNYRELKKGFGASIEQSIINNQQSSITFLASWLYPDAVAVARLAKDLGAPVWLRVHGTDRYHLKNRYRRRLVLDAVDYAKGVICNCRAVADDLVKAGVPSEKIHIVENGVDTSLFQYRDKEETSPVPQWEWECGNSQCILFVGNLVSVKGPDILLKAFAVVVKNYTIPLPRLLLIGSGPMLAQLQRLASTLGIADCVHFLGNRPHEEVAKWMNVVDVLCLASRSEGMPNVVLEARASGLPVVTTPVGAIPEMPLSKDHFLVVKSCSPEDLAEGLLTMLHRDLSNRKPDPVIPSWEGMADRILGLIGEEKR
jgi:glycosyltransferase involved in cell wall biosynthesis